MDEALLSAIFDIHRRAKLGKEIAAEEVEWLASVTIHMIGAVLHGTVSFVKSESDSIN